VRSTTHRTRPSPEPCSVWRRAISEPDAALAEFASVLVVVAAAVGDHPLRPLPRPTDRAAHRRHSLDQRHELGDVVAVAACDRPSERDPGGVYEQVMLGAVSGSINRGSGPLYRFCSERVVQ
jgi:hypothetical protein